MPGVFPDPSWLLRAVPVGPSRARAPGLRRACCPKWEVHLPWVKAETSGSHLGQETEPTPRWFQ